VFSESADAIARHDRVVACKQSEQSVKIDSGEFVDIADCKMFRLDATNAWEAVRLIKAGQGVKFEKPLTPMEKRLRDLFDSLKKRPPGRTSWGPFFSIYAYQTRTRARGYT
jgi:hypothetical protein